MARVNLFTSILVVAVSALVASVSRGQEVLMLVDPGAAWHAQIDLELADFLEADGYLVTVQDVATVPGEEQAELAADFDVVYIADSLGSTTTHDGVDTYLKDVEVPVISQEAYMWDEAEWTGRLQFEDFGDTFQALEDSIFGTFTDLDIVDPSHPMAAGLSGTVSVFNDPYGYNFGFVPEMGSDVDVIATIPENPDYATLFVYEPGTMLAEGTTTPGMRIGMYLGQNVAPEDLGGDGTNNRWDRLTPEGMALMKAAFDYATGRIGKTDPGDYNANGMLDAGDLDMHAQFVLNNDPTGDVDGDGDTDLDDRWAWIEQLQGSWVGDSNFDGEFNSSDFVTVFTAGKYETELDAGYAEGDWNGDMQFDSGDFVVAFSAGGYEQGPRAATQAVPEPSGTTLLLIASLIGLCSRRGMIQA